MALRTVGPRLLLLPASLLFGLFFVAPVAWLILLAFNPSAVGVARPRLEFTLDNFVTFAAEPLYRDALGDSLVVGVSATAVSLLLGYPLAYAIARSSSRRRSELLLFLLLVPLQVDILFRSYALRVLLGDNGLVNGALMGLGIVRGPLPLVDSAAGVLIGFVQFSTPIMALALLGSIRQIDVALIEAARNLGASRAQTFRTVELPLSLPGVGAGALLVLATTVSSYVVPALLGGGRVILLPTLIQQQVASVARWQFAAAIALVLVVITLLAAYWQGRIIAHFTRGLRMVST